MRLAHGFVVHSSEDKVEIARRYPLSGRPVKVIPHGPFDHHARSVDVAEARDAPATVCNILFFGTIRPYKGLEDLIEAFGSLERTDAQRYWLTVVGETWEEWTLPAELIERSPHRDRITFVNQYVTDDQVDAYFSGADAVALPYHRSSASGPLHVAMSYGHPTIVTRVGGLVEAAADYDGVVFIPAREPSAIRDAFARVAAMRGQKFADPHSWSRSVSRLGELFGEMERRSKRGP
jgi:glycosyltransferase involved in cell wall biosynthesis